MRQRLWSCSSAPLMVLLALVLSHTVSPSSGRAQGLGQLVVAPTGVLFEGKKRSTVVTLTNTGTTSATYRITMVNMRMAEDGTLSEVKEAGPGERFANRLIRYAPRRVVLAPGQTQFVRLLVRKPRDLPPGEYRSHLRFVVVPSQTAGANIETVDVGELRVRLNMIFGVSIPVFVRHGKLSATVTISDLKLEPGRELGLHPSISLRLERSGDRSVWGDVTVLAMTDGGDEIEIGDVRGVAIYTPNESRTLRLDLAPPDGVAIGPGPIKVMFRETADRADRANASAELPLVQ